MKLSSSRSGDVTELSSQGSTRADVWEHFRNGQAREGRQRQWCVHRPSAEKALGPPGSELQADACDKYKGGCLGFDLQSIRESKSSSLMGCKK